jgi:hypothetical protein
MNKPNLMNQIALTKRGQFFCNGFWESTWDTDQPYWSRFYRMGKLVGISHIGLPVERLLQKIII